MMGQLTIVSPSSRHEMAMNQHINIVRELFEPLLAHQRILRQIIELKLSNWLTFALLDLRDPQTVRERALARHQR
jgi:hypothetical protein